jgi:hypothetical protein
MYKQFLNAEVAKIPQTTQRGDFQDDFLEFLCALCDSFAPSAFKVSLNQENKK